MYPTLEVMQKLTSDLTDDYLLIVTPIVSEDAVAQCNCECDTGVIYTSFGVSGLDVTLTEEITPNYVGEYFEIETKIYYVVSQAVVSGKTVLTMDEDVKINLIGGEVELLDLPSGLILVIANEVNRNSTSGVDSESTGNASITYSAKNPADFTREVGGVIGCNSVSAGLTFT